MPQWFCLEHSTHQRICITLIITANEIAHSYNIKGVILRPPYSEESHRLLLLIMSQAYSGGKYIYVQRTGVQFGGIWSIPILSSYFHFVLFYNSTTFQRKIVCYIYLTAEFTNKTYDYCIKYNVFVKNGTLKLAPPEPVTTLKYAPLFTRLCITNDNSMISYRRDSVQFVGNIYYCSKILNVWLLYVNYYFHIIEWQSYNFFPITANINTNCDYFLDQFKNNNAHAGWNLSA